MLIMECLLIVIILPVLTVGNHCFTWQFKAKNTLSLNVSFQDFLPSDVFFITDSYSNKVATCNNHNCSLYNDRDAFIYSPERNLYRFTLLRDQATYFDGRWGVFRVDKEHLEAEISYTKGITDDTEVNIEAYVFLNQTLNRSFVHLTCWSCRVPDDQFAEFLINNKSESSIVFDPKSKHCFISNVLCNSGKCNCSQDGNSFEIVFEYREQNDLYSCDMIFNDDFIGSRFKKIASVYVDKTGVYTLPTRTIVIKQPSQNSTDQIHSSTTEEIACTNDTLEEQNRLLGTLLISIISYFTACVMYITCYAMAAVLKEKHKRFEKCFNSFCNIKKCRFSLSPLGMNLVLGWLSLIYFGFVAAITYSTRTWLESTNWLSEAIVISVISFCLGLAMAFIFMHENFPTEMNPTFKNPFDVDITEVVGNSTRASSTTASSYSSLQQLAGKRISVDRHNNTDGAYIYIRRRRLHGSLSSLHSQTRSERLDHSKKIVYGSLSSLHSQTRSERLHHSKKIVYGIRSAAYRHKRKGKKKQSVKKSESEVLPL